MVQGMERAVPDVFNVFALGKFSDFRLISLYLLGEVAMVGMGMLFEVVRVSN